MGVFGTDTTVLKAQDQRPIRIFGQRSWMRTSAATRETLAACRIWAGELTWCGNANCTAELAILLDALDLSRLVDLVHEVPGEERRKFRRDRIPNHPRDYVNAVHRIKDITFWKRL